MQTELLNIVLAFLEGFALIISPCILPVLPIILAGSLTGSKKRPFGIIVGFILVFALFTYFSRWLVQLLGIDLNLVRHVAFVILLLLGFIMLSDYLSEKFALLTQRLANVGSAIDNQREGFFNGILFGGLVALVWTPCAGPILAAVLVQTVIQQTNILSFFTLLAFGIGAAIPMLIIALFGRAITSRFTFFKAHGELFRKILGLLIIIGVALMALPIPTFSIGTSPQAVTGTNLQKGLMFPYPAPKIDGIDAWINSPPLKISDLKGKVVLIDFWTYSCINCVRTLPFLKAWYEKYNKDGFVIIGVHSPEFEFEKDLQNVKSAVEQDGIKYPVALDNHYVTWQNFNNAFWPAHYLIDKNGMIVYTHFGEGEYDVTENNIRYLLNINKTTPTTVTQETLSIYQTPETYLGYLRAANFSSPELILKNQPSLYSFPTSLSRNQWALQGDWNIMSDRIIAKQKNAAVKIHFYAKKVFMVMGSENNLPIPITILVNNKQTQLTVKLHTIYQIVEFDQAEDGNLQVTTTLPGLEIYTFTFG